MNVLVGCEFSGIVRDAFRNKGHDAWSCDLLPAEDNSSHHYEEPIEFVLRNKPDWDLMIAHPPCTYLCNSGVRWLYKNGERDEGRWFELDHARDFFMELLEEYPRIKKICVENPIPHKHAKLPKYTQIIQPYQFGHPETKATCLWLKNLPKLKPTNIVKGREQRVFKEPPSKERWKNRSRTYQGIADAMAEQWGNLN